MRIPFEWLNEYVDLKGLSAEEVSNALNLSGTENEVLSNLKDFPGIVVGEILEIEKHPNADRLRVTKTKVGKDVAQIVCGAPNIEVGQKIPVALPGALIGEFEIKETEIRGVKSAGMLCSEQELGIGEDHNGIMILDPRAKVGEPLGKTLASGGVVLEAEITPNRADCFSIIGNAREAAVSVNRKMKSLNYKTPEITSKKTVTVEVFEKELCPRYIAKVIEGVKIAESPEWLKNRLAESGVRPINNIVDVTNYVMLEWGQPLHAFDLEKVNNKILVRLAKDGEELETLDGNRRKLTVNDLVIADAKKPIGIAGVMGGANSEVSGKTKDIVLEAAVFNGTSVRKTAQRLALRTEASNRFEKGVPLQLPEIAIERAAQLIIETAGGQAGEQTDVLSKWIWKQRVGLSRKRLNQALGMKIESKKAVEILSSLGFEAAEFDFKKEARKHVGKPYVFGASFKTHGDLAFDCSYLTDYMYSKIGKFIGYTSLAQFELGEPVSDEELQPGDVLFVNGVIEKSVTDHYFIPDGKGGYVKQAAQLGQKVGHNAIYIGGGRIVHARHYEYDFDKKKWVKGKKAEVVEEDVEVFLNNPEYLGARRFVSSPKDYIAVEVPWWRLDIKIEEDLLEEIGRIVGYNNIPSKLPVGEMPAGEPNTEIENAKKVRTDLVAAGFSEIVSYSFVSGEMLKSVGVDLKETLKVSNPLSIEQEYMRTSILPTMIKAAATNQKNYERFDIFEIGKIYQGNLNSYTEKQVLGLVSKSMAKDKTEAFYRLKGALELLAKKQRLGALSFLPSKLPIYQSGRQAQIKLNNIVVGAVGMLASDVMTRFGLKNEVALAELDMQALFGAVDSLVYQPISKYPVAKRDINMVFDVKVSAQEITDAILRKDILISSEIADIYQGKGLQDNQKSVTISLTFGSTKRTLSDSEINESLALVIENLEKLGGKIRT